MSQPYSVGVSECMHRWLAGHWLSSLRYSGCGCHLKPSFPTDSAFNQISPVIPNQRMGMHPHCYVMTPDRLINHLSLKPTYINTRNQTTINYAIIPTVDLMTAQNVALEISLQIAFSSSFQTINLRYCWGYGQLLEPDFVLFSGACKNLS